MNTPAPRFSRFFLDGRPPRKADKFAAGTMSMRAAQYCDAVTLASGFGWWLFSPVDCLLMWDGRAIVWSEDGQEWGPVTDTVDFPGFPETWNERAPEGLRDCAPPFLTALPEPGLIQISLGLFLETAPGWSTYIGKPPNLPNAEHFEVFEGVVNTATWCGPLFANLRLTKTDHPIHLRGDMPLVQARPIHQKNFGKHILDFTTTTEPTAETWAAYDRTTVEPCRHPDRAFGAYAKGERPARRGMELCPAHAARDED